MKFIFCDLYRWNKNEKYGNFSYFIFVAMIGGMIFNRVCRGLYLSPLSASGPRTIIAAELSRAGSPVVENKKKITSVRDVVGCKANALWGRTVQRNERFVHSAGFARVSFFPLSETFGATARGNRVKWVRWLMQVKRVMTRRIKGSGSWSQIQFSTSLPIIRTKSKLLHTQIEWKIE